jgi:hypothetical protein
MLYYKYDQTHIKIDMKTNARTNMKELKKCRHLTISNHPLLLNDFMLQLI